MAAVYGEANYSKSRTQRFAILASSSHNQAATQTTTAKPSPTSNPRSPLESHQAALDRAVNRVTWIIYSLQGQTDLRLETSQLVPDVSPTLYQEVVAALNKHSDHSVADYFNSKLDYEYDERLKTLIVKCETKQHECTSAILANLVNFMAAAKDFYPSGWADNVMLGGSPTIKLSDNYNNGEFKPDGTLRILNRQVDFPTLLIEVAHSQTEEELLKVGIRWLKGSHGRICTVVLIKINYPLPVQEVKIWVYRAVEDKDAIRIKKWGPRIIYRPPPASLPEPDQTLNFSLRDILSERIVSLPAHKRQHRVSIPFRLLAAWCHTALKDFVPLHNPDESTELARMLGKRMRCPISDIEQTSHREAADDTSTTTHSDQDDKPYTPPRSTAPIASSQGRNVRNSTKRAGRTSED